MRCPKCQHENPDDARFCNGCGNRLELICPECGKMNPPGSRFCNACGRDLQAPEEAAPVNYNQPQSYTPKFLADKILTKRSSIEGERKLVTVLFADVADYTSLAEKVDPEEVHQIMDGCFQILMEAIHRHGGARAAARDPRLGEHPLARPGLLRLQSPGQDLGQGQGGAGQCLPSDRSQ